MRKQSEAVLRFLKAFDNVSSFPEGAGPTCARIAGSHTPSGDRSGARRGVLRRLGIALFALVLAFLTSIAQFSPACADEPVHPAPDDTGAYDAGRGSPDDRIPAPPRVGGLMLGLIQTALVSAGSFMLYALPFLTWLGAPPAPTRLLEPAPSGFHIRAPPQR